MTASERRLGLGMTVMALMRAAEAQRPATERLFDDSVSRLLLPGLWKVLLLPGVRHALLALTEKRGPGALGNIYCRTRYIDDMLCNALRKGIKQVVILGAGFDARASRIPGIERTHVFELDLPEPQQLKQARLCRALGALPAHVTYISTDFDRERFSGILPAAGYRADQRAFFIWEGVTQYISPEAVDSMFRTVAAAAPGSEIVFTYIERGIVDGTERTKADQKLVDAAARGGMPWIFGLDPAEIDAYLAARGLTRVDEIWTPEYQRRYLNLLGRRLTVFAGEHVVLARVGD